MKRFVGTLLAVSTLWSGQAWGEDFRPDGMQQRREMNEKISREVRQIIKTADPSQVGDMVRKAVTRATEPDVLSTLSAPAAYAYELKLDSLKDNRGFFTFEYDTEHALLLSCSYFSEDNGKRSLKQTDVYQYDDQNRMIHRVETYYRDGVMNSRSTSKYEYQESGRTASYSYRSEYFENGTVTDGSGQESKYDENGFTIYSAYLNYDAAVGFYPSSAYEYEYYPLEPYMHAYAYDYKITKKSISYACPSGSTVLVPSSRYSYDVDGDLTEVYVNGKWLTSRKSYFDDSHWIRTYESYNIDGGVSWLAYKEVERRYGWGNFNGAQRRYYIYLNYDRNGNITSGSKEDCLHDWGSTYQTDHYYWDTSTMGWAFDRSEGNGYNYNPYPSEGDKRSIIEYGGDMSDTEQVFKNGKWVTYSYWEAESKYEKNSVFKENPVYQTGTLHSLSYKIDTETGAYTDYSETFCTYGEGKSYVEQTYSAPDRKNLIRQQEFRYDNKDNLLEESYYEVKNGRLALSSVVKYEYDYNMDMDIDVLHSQNTQAKGSYYSPYPYSFASGSSRPISVKRYAADGTFMEDLTLYYYSTLDGDGGNISIVEGETSYSNNAEVKATSLTYTRSFNNTKWQALYVPFAMSYDDWAAQDCEVSYINGFLQYDNDRDGEIDETVMSVISIKDGQLKPNTPYLIKANSVGEKTFNISDRTLYPTQENEASCSSMTTTFTFKGNYHTLTAANLLNQESYFMSNGELVQSDGIGSLNPFRWHLTLTARDPMFAGSKPARATIRVQEDKEPLGITDLNDDIANASSIYNLNGQRVSASAMTRGIYVIDNKKVLVK